MPFRMFLLILAVAITAVTPTVALAGSPMPGVAPLVASYWSNFLEHWSGVLQRQNGVVMAALVIGAVCLFVITRGKWIK